MPTAPVQEADPVTLATPANGRHRVRPAAALLGRGPRHRQVRRRAQPRRPVRGRARPARPASSASAASRARSRTTRSACPTAPGTGASAPWTAATPARPGAAPARSRSTSARPAQKAAERRRLGRLLAAHHLVAGHRRRAPTTCRSRATRASRGDVRPCLTTAQTALVPPKARDHHPGRPLLARPRQLRRRRRRASGPPTRNFRSVFPPDFNLNTVPSQVGLPPHGRGQRPAQEQRGRRRQGAPLPRAPHLPERHVQAAGHRSAPTRRAGSAFSLKMSRSADYRLVWREEATHPEGAAAFGIDVQPRVTFRLAPSRVVRKRGLVVQGQHLPQAPGRHPDEDLRRLADAPQGHAHPPALPGLGVARVASTRARTACASGCRATRSASSPTSRAASAACSSTTGSSSADAPRRPHRLLGDRRRASSASRSAPSPPCWPRAGRRGSRS